MGRLVRLLPTQPWPVALALGLAVAAQAEVWTGMVVGGPPLAVASAQLLGTLPVAWCRRLPTTAVVLVWGALVVVAALGVDLSTTTAATAAGLVTCAAAGHDSRRPTLALGAALALGAVAIVVESGTERLEDIVFVGGLSAALWTSGRAVAVRELREEVLRQRADQLAEEAEWRAEAAVAGERVRIARELHDLMAHSVSVMVLHAGGVRRALGDEHEEERRALLTVEKAGREALDDMRRVVGVLREEPEAAPRGPQPRTADADELLEPARAAGLTAEIRVVGIPRALPPGIDVSAYRILQEAVTNVLRHARASRVTCTLRYDDDAVRLEVVDDGARAAARASGRDLRPDRARTAHGLVGMRERVALYGGSLDAGHLPDAGYRVAAVLPLPVQAT
jgi:signal transduction histidine kinase